jgi:hypothetical protein
MMKHVISIGLAGVVALVIFGSRVASAHRALPAVTLSGTKLIVPADLPKKAILFVIGFSKASRPQTAAWSRALAGRFSNDTVGVYSASVIEEVPWVLRGFVASRIRDSIPTVLHDRFLLISKRSCAWKEMVAFIKPDTAYLVLMDISREVVFRESGPVTRMKLQALADELKSLEGKNAKGSPAGRGQ